MSGLGFGTRVSPRADMGTVALPSGDGRTVQIIGLKEVLRMFNDLDGELRKTANGELRQAARKIADDLQQKVQSSGGGPAPQGAAVAQTARARNDRIVKVAVPGVNIRFSRESVGGSRRGAVAFGANYGPAGSINYYKVARNTSGYFVEPAVDDVMNLADERYMTALDSILRRYGLIG
jgi:hypothetical protein